MLPHTITLTNWRSFSSTTLHLPQKSFLIQDKNGSGKTSILSAMYSLYTGQPFPNTKFPDFLRQNQQYLGISTENNEWYINGQISPSGRLVIKRSTPQFDTRSVVLTYQPNDNYWLELSRGQKLGILDALLSQVYIKEYVTVLGDLEKVVKGKTNLLKYYHDTGVKPDEIIARQLHEKVVVFSDRLWSLRAEFFEFVESRLVDFSNLISSELTNWRVKIHKKGDFSGDFEGMWHKEMVVGKVLYGAQRDDFSIEAGHLGAQQVLSRGEMRLLVLYIKNLAREMITASDICTIWLLDDVFNELDDEREEIVCRQILDQADYFIATGTRNPGFVKDVYGIGGLV
jgi:recombinational DNA repair ATPase RecF